MRRRHRPMRWSTGYIPRLAGFVCLMPNTFRLFVTNNYNLKHKWIHFEHKIVWESNEDCWGTHESTVVVLERHTVPRLVSVRPTMKSSNTECTAVYQKPSVCGVRGGPPTVPFSWLPEAEAGAKWELTPTELNSDSKLIELKIEGKSATTGATAGALRSRLITNLLEIVQKWSECWKWLR